MNFEDLDEETKLKVFTQHQKEYVQKRTKQEKTRLTVKDFEDKGIDVVHELWQGLQRIEDPKDYMDVFLRMLRMVFPLVSSIDITQEVRSEGKHQIDLSGIPKEKLVQLLRDSA